MNGAGGGKQPGKPAGGQVSAASGGASSSRKTGRPSDAALKPPPTPTTKTMEKAKAAQAVAVDQGAGSRTRGLLIFSHFGLPKPVSAAKGDVHPAIARTALQFSSFKIVGANARCIATLTAFKTVRGAVDVANGSKPDQSSGHPRLHYASQQHALPSFNDIPLPANQSSRRGTAYVCDHGQRSPSAEA